MRHTADARSTQVNRQDSSTHDFSLFPREPSYEVGSRQPVNSPPADRRDLSDSTTNRPAEPGQGRGVTHDFSLFPREPSYEASSRQPVNSPPAVRRGLSDSTTNRPAEPGQGRGVAPSSLTRLTQSLFDIGIGNYEEVFRFISNYPQVLGQSEIEVLIREAQVAEQAGSSSRAKVCIHQALLLRKWNQLGRDRVDFVQQMVKGNRRTVQEFLGDVNEVYSKTQQRAREGNTRAPTVTDVRTDRGRAVISQDPNPRSSRDSLSRKESSETHKPQPRLVRDRDNRLVYVDDLGREIRPATSRRDPNPPRRGGDASGPIAGLTAGIASVNISGDRQAQGEAPEQPSIPGTYGHQSPTTLIQDISNSREPQTPIENAPRPFQPALRPRRPSGDRSPLQPILEGRPIRGTEGDRERLDSRMILESGSFSACSLLQRLRQAT